MATVSKVRMVTMATVSKVWMVTMATVSKVRMVIMATVSKVRIVTMATVSKVWMVTMATVSKVWIVTMATRLNRFVFNNELYLFAGANCRGSCVCYSDVSKTKIGADDTSWQTVIVDQQIFTRSVWCGDDMIHSMI
jgi:hypothetical protein